VKSTEWLPFVVIGRQIWLARTHWVDGHSVECTKETGECENCKPGGRERWTGYLHAVQIGSTNETFLVLPHGTCCVLLDGLNNEYDLRGRKLSLKRAGKAQTTELLCLLDPHFRYAGELPPERDPSPIVTEIMNKRQGLTIHREAQ
jgi:hypothetical protein